MRIEGDIKIDYNNVLMRPKRSTLGSRKDVDLCRNYTFKHSNNSFHGIPIMAANMDGVGTFKMADELSQRQMFTCLTKIYTKEELISYFDSEDVDSSIRESRSNHVAMSIGITDRDGEKFCAVYDRVGEKLKYVCIDVANGYTKFFSDFIKEFRLKHPKITIIAGNVVTADQTQELIINGADIIKCGIGPGSVCTTRIQTGVGYPQLSAVIECADAAHGLGGRIIADGGCTVAGDLSKAFAGGADFVMLGGMLAGHDQGGGELVDKYYHSNELELVNGNYQPMIEKKQFVKFYGMSSDVANIKHFGGLKDYRSSEGREILVSYRGDVGPTIQNILGGLRSACTYVGAPSLKQISRCTTFIRCNDTHNRIFENGP